MKTLVTLCILVVVTSTSLFAHQSDLVHSHTGLEYLIFIIALVGLAIVLFNKK